MKNKQLYLLPLVSMGLLTQGTTSASPLVSIGDSADVFFNGSSSVRWASNIFRDEFSEVDDLYWTLSPGFELNVGRGVSNADLSVITRYDIIRYQDNDQLDVELFHIKAIGSYRTSRLDLSGTVSFDENKTSSGENNVINDLIAYDNTAARFGAEYRFSPKFSFGSGVKYREQEYQTFVDRFADREVLDVPFDVFYELTPKVDLTVGYVYTNTDIEKRILPTADPLVGLETAGYETNSHFFNVGARGNLLPKLSGYFKAGYRVRSSDDSARRNVVLSSGATTGAALSSTTRDNTGMLGLDADLNWTASPKLQVRLGMSRDFGVGGEGNSTENSSVNLTGMYSINSYFSASSNLGYTLRDYTDNNREDNQYLAGLRLTYRPNEYWSFATGYTYSDNSSNQANSSYVNHTVDLTATLRY